MLKRDVLKLFDESKLNDYVYSVQFGRIKLDEISDYYKHAVRMVLKYGCNWWKHIHTDCLNKCIITEDDDLKRINIGIIRSIDLQSDFVYIYNKRNPVGHQNYRMSYYDFESRIANGLYPLRLVSNYLDVT